jgi:fructosamine-3-kinase
VNNPLGICELNGLEFFFLEFIDLGPISANYWGDFGLQLSNLQKSTSRYYGNREMEIAMTKMVGSFDLSFYESYHATYPLQNDWEIRMDFCHMYYHLVNLNNYCIPYLPMIEEQLDKWVQGWLPLRIIFWIFVGMYNS